MVIWLFPTAVIATILAANRLYGAFSAEWCLFVMSLMVAYGLGVYAEAHCRANGSLEQADTGGTPDA